MKPKRKPVPERMTLTKLGTLLEAQGKEIAIIAEGVADIRPRILRLEDTVQSLVEDMKFLKPIVQKNSKDIEELKTDIAVLKRDVKEIKERLQAYDKRLETVEAKLVV